MRYKLLGVQNKVKNILFTEEKSAHTKNYVIMTANLIVTEIMFSVDFIRNSVYSCEFLFCF